MNYCQTIYAKNESVINIFGSLIFVITEPVGVQELEGGGPPMGII